MPKNLATDYALFYIMPLKFSPTFQTAYVEYAYQILDKDVQDAI